MIKTLDSFFCACKISTLTLNNEHGGKDGRAYINTVHVTSSVYIEVRGVLAIDNGQMPIRDGDGASSFMLISM